MEALEVTLSESQIESLMRYQKTLEKWAPKINLVSDWRPNITAETHFLDSLALNRILPPECEHIVDIGSGAGFPGLVLAISNPHRKVMLVEPIAKRASFLQQVSIQCGLKNVEVRIQRSDLLQAPANSVAMARAVLPPKKWVQEGDRIAGSHGWVVLMTAKRPPPEVLESAEECHLSVVKMDSFFLPFSTVPRTNTLFKRASS